jgi:hypothetical protein
MIIRRSAASRTKWWRPVEAAHAFEPGMRSPGAASCLVEAEGIAVPRPAAKDGTPSENLDDRARRVQALMAVLTGDVPGERAERRGADALGGAPWGRS